MTAGLRALQLQGNCEEAPAVREHAAPARERPTSPLSSTGRAPVEWSAGPMHDGGKRNHHQSRDPVPTFDDDNTLPFALPAVYYKEAGSRDADHIAPRQRLVGSRLRRRAQRALPKSGVQACAWAAAKDGAGSIRAAFLTDRRLRLDAPHQTALSSRRQSAGRRIQ
jgi:hypothetical protein